MKIFKFIAIIFTIAVVLQACEKEDTLNVNITLPCEEGEHEHETEVMDGLNSLISTDIEMNGENCASGGIKISTGLDVNRNNILEKDEVSFDNFICNGEGEGGDIHLDKLTRLEIGSPNVNSCGNTWFLTPYETFTLVDFNKLDYDNTSSIIFVPGMFGGGSGNTVTAQLYNVTDSIPIKNTFIQHFVPEYEFKYSENIYDDLPDYPITLGIRTKNSKNWGCGGLGIRSYLYIKRD